MLEIFGYIIGVIGILIVLCIMKSRRTFDKTLDTLKQLTEQLHEASVSIQRSLIILTDIHHPKILHCELNLHLLD